MWRIWLEELPPTASWPKVVEAGWFGAGAVGVTSINRALYMRTQDKDRALVFRDEEAVIREIMDNRRHGYPCRADPPISRTF